MQWSAALKALNSRRVEGCQGDAGGGQGAHPHCLPDGECMLSTGDGGEGIHPHTPHVCFRGQATEDLGGNKGEIEK